MRFKLIKIIPFLLICSIKSTAYADNIFDAGFQKGIDTASSMQGKSFTSMQEFKPENYIKNYTTQPREVNYVDKGDQLKADGIDASQHSEMGKTINEGMEDRERQFNYPIDPASPAIQNIKKRSDAVYDVITGQFGDCTKQTICKITYENKNCEETPKSITQYCRKTLHIDMVPHQEDKHYSLTAKVSVNGHDYAGVSVNVVSGAIGFLGPRDARFNLAGLLPNNIDCHSLSGKIISKSGNANLDYINFPSCGNGLALDFHISGGHNITLKLDIISSKIVYEPKDTWQNDCTVFENIKQCVFQGEHCISKEATQIIQNIPVTRSCWEKEASFICRGSGDTSTCETYRSQGCEQTGSTCQNRNDSGCTLYKQTYRCPIKQCTDVGMICNGEMYCLTKECVKQQKQADPDFQKGIAGLSAVDAAAKSYGANPGAQFPIFSGVAKTCNKDFLSFANCCSDSGWGIDLNLGRCDQEAKDLGKAKDKGLVVYIDSDDSCVLGLCGHKKRYCVFPSKLARIIQEKGRYDQLHISFGDFDHPDCRGLTVAEFSSLNLKEINFSEIYSDITQNMKIEDASSINQRVSQKMKEWEKEKKPHG